MHVPHTPDEKRLVLMQYQRGDFDAYIMWVHTNAVPWQTYDDMFNPKDMSAPKISFQAMHQMRLPTLIAELDKFHANR